MCNDSLIHSLFLGTISIACGHRSRRRSIGRTLLACIADYATLNDDGVPIAWRKYNDKTVRCISSFYHIHVVSRLNRRHGSKSKRTHSAHDTHVRRTFSHMFDAIVKIYSSMVRLRLEYTYKISFILIDGTVSSSTVDDLREHVPHDLAALVLDDNNAFDTEIVEWDRKRSQLALVPYVSPSVRSANQQHYHQFSN